MKFDNIAPISDGKLADLYLLAALTIIPIRGPAPDPLPPPAAYGKTRRIRKDRA